MADLAAELAIDIFEQGAAPARAALRGLAERRLCLAFGTAIAGAQAPGVTAVLATGAVLGGAPRAIVPGRSERTDPTYAALATAFAGASVPSSRPESDFGVPLLGTLVGIYGRDGASGDALRAFGHGFEIALRLERVLGPDAVLRGWSPLGACGPLGCAVAGAVALDLDAAGIARALRLASGMTLGLRPAVRGDAACVQAGKIATNGMFAALLAREGLDGPAGVLEAPDGWAHAHVDRPQTEALRSNGNASSFDRPDRAPGRLAEASLLRRLRSQIDPTLGEGSGRRLAEAIRSSGAAGDFRRLLACAIPTAAVHA